MKGLNAELLSDLVRECRCPPLSVTYLRMCTILPGAKHFISGNRNRFIEVYARHALCAFNTLHLTISSDVLPICERARKPRGLGLCRGRLALSSESAAEMTPSAPASSSGRNPFLSCPWHCMLSYHSIDRRPKHSTIPDESLSGPFESS